MTPAVLSRFSRRRTLTVRWRDERGEGAVSAAIIAPIIITTTFGLIQAGMYYHARNVVSSAAQVGVEDARAYGASAGAGQSSAQHYLDEVAPTLLEEVSVSSSRGGGTARVSITASAPSLVPGISLPRLNAEAVSPVEEVTRP